MSKSKSEVELVETGIGQDICKNCKDNCDIVFHDEDDNTFCSEDCRDNFGEEKEDTPNNIKAGAWVKWRDGIDINIITGRRDQIFKVDHAKHRYNLATLITGPDKLHETEKKYLVKVDQPGEERIEKLIGKLEKYDNAGLYLNELSYYPLSDQQRATLRVYHKEAGYNVPEWLDPEFDVSDNSVSSDNSDDSSNGSNSNYIKKEKMDKGSLDYFFNTRTTIHKDQIVDRLQLRNQTNQDFIDSIVENFNPNMIGLLMFQEIREGEYLLLDGNHRLPALIELGYEQIPAEIVSDDEAYKVKMAAYTSNESRQPFTIDEKIRIISDLWEEAKEVNPDYSYRDFEKDTGVTKSTVDRYTTIKSMHPNIIKAIQGGLSLSAAYELRKLDRIQQGIWATRFMENKLTTNEVKSIVSILLDADREQIDRVFRKDATWEEIKSEIESEVSHVGQSEEKEEKLAICRSCGERASTTNWKRSINGKDIIFDQGMHDCPKDLEKEDLTLNGSQDEVLEQIEEKKESIKSKLVDDPDITMTEGEALEIIKDVNTEKIGEQITSLDRLQELIDKKSPVIMVYGDREKGETYAYAAVLLKLIDEDTKYIRAYYAPEDPVDIESVVFFLDHNDPFYRLFEVWKCQKNNVGCKQGICNHKSDYQIAKEKQDKADTEKSTEVKEETGDSVLNYLRSNFDLDELAEKFDEYKKEGERIKEGENLEIEDYVAVQVNSVNGKYHYWGSVTEKSEKHKNSVAINGMWIWTDDRNYTIYKQKDQGQYAERFHQFGMPALCSACGQIKASNMFTCDECSYQSCSSQHREFKGHNHIFEVVDATFEEDEEFSYLDISREKIRFELDAFNYITLLSWLHAPEEELPDSVRPANIDDLDTDHLAGVFLTRGGNWEYDNALCLWIECNDKYNQIHLNTFQKEHLIRDLTNSAFIFNNKLEIEDLDFEELGVKALHQLLEGGQREPVTLELNTTHEIYNKSSESMDEVEDDSIHLIVTSQPYNANKQYDNRDKNADSISWDAYISKMGKVVSECYRVLKQGGRLVLNVANLMRPRKGDPDRDYLPLNIMMREIALDHGFIQMAEKIWYKGEAANVTAAWGTFQSPGLNHTRDTHEYIMIFSKPDDEGLLTSLEHDVEHDPDITRDEFLLWTKSVWKIAPAKDPDHECVYPPELVKRAIKLLTWPGQKVLDPFSGSGTTAAVAEELQRDSISYEIVPRYIDLIESKIRTGVKQWFHNQPSPEELS